MCLVQENVDLLLLKMGRQHPYHVMPILFALKYGHMVPTNRQVWVRVWVGSDRYKRRASTTDFQCTHFKPLHPGGGNGENKSGPIAASRFEQNFDQGLCSPLPEFMHRPQSDLKSSLNSNLKHRFPPNRCRNGLDHLKFCLAPTEKSHLWVTKLLVGCDHALERCCPPVCIAKARPKA